MGFKKKAAVYSCNGCYEVHIFMDSTKFKAINNGLTIYAQDFNKKVLKRESEDFESLENSYYLLEDFVRDLNLKKKVKIKDYGDAFYFCSLPKIKKKKLFKKFDCFFKT